MVFNTGPTSSLLNKKFGQTMRKQMLNPSMGNMEDMGRSGPQFDFAQMPQPTSTPMEDSQLWKAYNRLTGGQIAPRLLR